jgi:hypothetical protein
MTSIIDARLKHRRTACLTAGVVFTAILTLGAFTGTAGADERREHGDRGGRGEHHGWNGGYYRAPPAVYGYERPYYAPPVVYGPGIGLNLNIR